MIQEQDESYKSLSEYFKIDPKKHFLVFVKTAEKLKYLYNGELEGLTKEDADQFIKDVEGKKVKGFKLDQETRPAGAAKTADEL